jgi:hypothetical protein
MSPVAYAKAYAHTRLQFGAGVLPVALSINTVALVAYDQLFGIPVWVKTAAAFFLAF